ncbi:hypothetical protein [Hydrogenispora ethanolica]|nr:hypothetical protein [Hydrogenispora ethanolica]
MPIVYCGRSGSIRMVPHGFADPIELRELVTLHPELLQVETEPPLALVRSHPELPGTDPLDSLFVAWDGHLSIVKVQRIDDRPVSRQFFAQVFEFIAELARLTPAQLNQRLDGALEQALRQFLDDPDDEYGLESCWQSCESYLRAGKVRLVMVADQAPEELIKAFQFIREHSDLDVRLVVIRRYSGTDGEAVYLPEMVVCGAVSVAPIRTPAAPVVARPEFEAVIAAYSRIAIEGFEPRGKAGRYRILRPDWWPRGIHYEFFDYGGEIGVEIHLESPEVGSLADMLRSFEGQFATVFPSAFVNWDSAWSEGRGRLRVLVSSGASPLDVVGAMKVMIKQTWTPINDALAGLGLIPAPETAAPAGTGPNPEPAKPEEPRSNQKTITIGDQNIIIELDRLKQPLNPAVTPEKTASSFRTPPLEQEAASRQEAAPSAAGARENSAAPVEVQETAKLPAGIGNGAMPGFIEIVDENGRSSLVNLLKMGHLANFGAHPVSATTSPAAVSPGAQEPEPAAAEDRPAPEPEMPRPTPLQTVESSQSKSILPEIFPSGQSGERPSPPAPPENEGLVSLRRSSRQLEELLSKLEGI